MIVIKTIFVYFIVFIKYFYILPGDNTTVLDCIEVKYNPKITTKKPIKSSIIY